MPFSSRDKVFINNETEFALINRIVYDSFNSFCYLIKENLITGLYRYHFIGFLT